MNARKKPTDIRNKPVTQGVEGTLRWNGRIRTVPASRPRPARTGMMGRRTTERNEEAAMAAEAEATARATVQYEDEQVRVTRWDFEPGTTTGPHVHAYDYLVVPVADGRVTVRGADGTSAESQLRTGETYARKAGAAHEVVNTGAEWLAFVEIELKQQPAAGE
ncbi:hypothetical protein Sxan_27430 [Streptomyces xanthophaeus]|uniref:Cupin type-2 domain-containing protein n=2 Tax=Streptomyces xanthophaeus TaxID=67385 RepID=A0A919GWS9_9ACTN|nr:hypothetical protein Sxan_27430 [Streptomyces xanthophaeus]